MLNILLFVLSATGLHAAWVSVCELVIVGDACIIQSRTDPDGLISYEDGATLGAGICINPI